MLVTDSEYIHRRAAAIKLPSELRNDCFLTGDVILVLAAFPQDTLPGENVLNRLRRRHGELPHINSTMSNLDGAIALKAQASPAVRDRFTAPTQRHEVARSFGPFADITSPTFQEFRPSSKSSFYCLLNTHRRKR